MLWAERLAATGPTPNEQFPACRTATVKGAWASSFNPNPTSPKPETGLRQETLEKMADEDDISSFHRLVLRSLQGFRRSKE